MGLGGIATPSSPLRFLQFLGLLGAPGDAVTLTSGNVMETDGSAEFAICCHGIVGTNDAAVIDVLIEHGTYWILLAFPRMKSLECNGANFR